MRHRTGIGVIALFALNACTVTSGDSGTGGAAGDSSEGGSSSVGGNAPTTGGSAGSVASTGGNSTTGGTGGTTSTGGSGGSVASTGGAGGSTASGGSTTNGGSGGGDACPTGSPCGTIDAYGVCTAGKVQKCFSPPVGATTCQPVIRETVCPSYAPCAIDTDGQAKCLQTTACVPNIVDCDPSDATGATLRTCAADGSGYTSTVCDSGSVCKSDPQTGTAACNALPQAPTTGGPTLSGHVQFERHGYDTSFNETAATYADAWLQFVAIYNVDGTGAQTYVGSAITGPDGTFQAGLSAPADANTIVYVYSLDFADGSNTPLVAVVPNDDPMIQTQAATDYWFWSNQGSTNGACQMTSTPVNPGTGGQATLSATMQIPEACGSGAINVFQWVRYGMYRMGDPTYGVKATNTEPQESIAVFWSPGQHADACGACFYNGGGATVTPMGTSTVDHYDTLMQISGDDDSPTQWSYSVMSHETGHWVMDNYSKSPGEGGQHFVDAASIAGLAYSEGWATAFGLWNQSQTDTTLPNPDFDATYVDKQQGTVFWVKVDQAVYSGGALQLPNPSGDPGQNINENVISDMIWHLWQPADAGAATGDTKYAGIGPENVFTFFQSPRLKTGAPRAYTDANGTPRLCVADFFDAYSCAGGTDSNVTEVNNIVGYPWGTKTCQ